MAGRYQGYHRLPNAKGDRGVEVFWQQNGWFWRPRPSEYLPGNKTVGPFTTSTEAYHHAREQLASAAPKNRAVW
jgi:hypothetical protein